MFTQLNCKHFGGAYFTHAPGSLIKKPENWLKMLVYHYMKYHKDFVSSELTKEANDAVIDERKNATATFK